MVAMGTAARRLSLRAHLGPDKHADALANLYFALFTGDPFGAGAEPTSTGGYARVTKANDAALWGTIAAGQLTAPTLSAITWPIATGLYSTGATPLTHWAAFDNASGGVLWYGGPLTSSIVVSGANDQPRLPAGALTISQTG
jgi:hypothetical protein